MTTLVVLGCQTLHLGRDRKKLDFEVMGPRPLGQGA